MGFSLFQISLPDTARRTVSGWTTRATRAPTPPGPTSRDASRRSSPKSSRGSTPTSRVRDRYETNFRPFRGPLYDVVSVTRDPLWDLLLSLLPFTPLCVSGMQRQEVQQSMETNPENLFVLKQFEQIWEPGQKFVPKIKRKLCY